MTPIGRGQRELIIGDRQTGKTTIAIDTILNQNESNPVHYHVAIGQKASTVASIVKQSLMLALCLIQRLSQQMQLILLQPYIATYAGCSMESTLYNGLQSFINYL